MQGASTIVGTAGHIDHGKSSLVRTLTGVDPDTLPEEKERGITIALGFAPMRLPDGRTVAFVDVPGHEKLVRTMVAGATGIDAVLLCISAMDGAMPQTREHLAILTLLGVSQGAVVLTMADLVDAELLALAREDASALVRGTFLEGRPIVPYSSVTGAGRDELLAVIASFGQKPRPTDGAFRLPVDRTFVRTGFGTVVTGTVASGELEDGALVQLLPGDGTARVRGIQVHGEASTKASSGWRAALNLAGIERAEVPRGTVVTSGSVACSAMIDVRYRHLASSEALQDDVPIRILHGTAERIGRLHIAEDRDQIEPGTSVWAQLRLDAPLVCWPGDRFVLRRPSPEETLGGGEIVDPWAPRLRAKDRVRCGEELTRLARGDRQVWLERAGETGLAAADVAARRITGGVTLGERVLSPKVTARLEGALIEALGNYHASHPLAEGAPRRELFAGRLEHLGERSFDALTERLAANRAVVTEGPSIRLSAFKIGLSKVQQELRKRILASIVVAGFDGLAPKALHEKHPEPEVHALAQLLESAGDIQPVAGLGWVGKDVIEDLEARIRKWFSGHEDLTPGDFKELTGLSRKGAIPWLEWLDKTRWTRRVGDVRKRGPK